MICNYPPMKKYLFLLITGMMVIAQGCSSESVKRTSFETLQNVREQQCSKDLTSNCPPRESFNDYQRKRNEALEPEKDHNDAPPAPAGQ